MVHYTREGTTDADLEEIRPSRAGKFEEIRSSRAGKFMNVEKPTKGNTKGKFWKKNLLNIRNVINVSFFLELSMNAKKMGESLYKLLQNIIKLPTPPPIANILVIGDCETYRAVLLTHLSKIKDVDEFYKHDIFLNSSNKEMALSTSAESSSTQAQKGNDLLI